MSICLADIDIGAELGDALGLAFGMFWEILWALILSFAISAAVQAVVSKAEMRRLLPDDSGSRSLGRGFEPRRLHTAFETGCPSWRRFF